MKSMKSTLIAIATFLILMIFVPIILWWGFDLGGEYGTAIFRYMIIVGLMFGGWLGWTLITRAFFGK